MRERSPLGQSLKELCQFHFPKIVLNLALVWDHLSSFMGLEFKWSHTKNKQTHSYIPQGWTLSWTLLIEIKEAKQKLSIFKYRISPLQLLLHEVRVLPKSSVSAGAAINLNSMSSLRNRVIA